MAYKKPQMVAKSSAKKSYVAGCPEVTPWYGDRCTSCNTCCMCGPLSLSLPDEQCSGRHVGRSTSLIRYRE